MNPEELSATLLAVVTLLAEARREGSTAGLTASDLPLERPKNRDHGDWASNAALKLGKEAVHRQAGMGLADAYAHTSRVMVENMLARDAEEGIGAFLEKREPRWRGC